MIDQLFMGGSFMSSTSETKEPPFSTIIVRSVINLLRTPIVSCPLPIHSEIFSSVIKNLMLKSPYVFENSYT